MATQQEVSLASCVFEGEGLSACVAGSTASFRVRACDARGYTVASVAADFTLTVVVDGKEIPGGGTRGAVSPVMSWQGSG